MFNLRPSHSHFLFAVFQSALTCGIASAIAVAPHTSGAVFVTQWLIAWGTSWIVMMPIVLIAAPLIRRFVAYLTH